MTANQDRIAEATRANREGVMALRAGDHAAAQRAFEQATAADPDALPLWINLAHANRLLGDRTAERAALERALAIDRADFTASLRMAQWAQAAGEDEMALQLWSGVQQLAVGVPEINPQVRAELAAGAAWCADLQDRLGRRVDAAMATLAAPGSQTEQRRISAFVDHALGRRAIFHNECAGLHYPFLPADEYFDRSQFDWLSELEAATPAIQAEFAALFAAPGDLAKPYVQMEPGTPPNKWSALDQSYNWTACFLWEYGRPHQAALDRCPQTARVLAGLPLARIPGRAPNAFFSVLRAHSHIPPHTGVTNTRAIIHLALQVPPGCGFRVGGETREWREGHAFAFDDTIEHEAWNTSDMPRAVLIIDTWNPHLSQSERDAIVAYYQAVDAGKTDPC